ncbi:hypothetical protein [Streptomyces antibioticus]|uniref:hypothetical protein n=1 Tax=Streptomyces antibioticus TaxID=1890 RepID=UPI0033D9533F
MAEGNGCALPTKKHTGGFSSTREFGFDLEKKFPTLDLNEVDTEGAAVVVTIDNPRSLHLHKLSRYLTKVAEGGIKTAIISVPSRGLITALPIFNLFMVVDENAELKDLQRLERAMRTGV